MGQWGVAGLLGPAGDCTPAIEAVNAPEAQCTGPVRRHGRVQPPCYTHRRPIDGASIARSTALAQRPGIDDGSLVSGWPRFLLSVCLAAFLLWLIRCRRFWVKARESSDNRLPIVPLLRPRHPKSPTANYPQQNRGDGPGHLSTMTTTAARRRLPTSALASRCPGGISRADWGALVHVCWPDGAQTRHVWLSQLLQASHRRLGIVV